MKFLGFVNVSDTYNWEEIYPLTKLEQLNLNLHDLRDQRYDYCANTKKKTPVSKSIF